MVAAGEGYDLEPEATTALKYIRLFPHPYSFLPTYNNNNFRRICPGRDGCRKRRNRNAVVCHADVRREQLTESSRPSPTTRDTCPVQIFLLVFFFLLLIPIYIYIYIIYGVQLDVDYVIYICTWAESELQEISRRERTFWPRNARFIAPGVDGTPITNSTRRYDISGERKMIGKMI